MRFACRASYVRTAAVKNVEIQLIDGTIIPVPGAEPGGVSGGPAAAAGRADGDVSKKAALIALAGGPDSPFFNGYITIPTRAGDNGLIFRD